VLVATNLHADILMLEHLGEGAAAARVMSARESPAAAS
jgi:hypothetical protein